MSSLCIGGSYFSQCWGLGSPRSKWLQVGCLVRAHFLYKFTSCQCHFVTTTPTIEGQGLLTGVTNHIQEVPSHNLLLPNGPCPLFGHGSFGGRVTNIQIMAVEKPRRKLLRELWEYPKLFCVLVLILPKAQASDVLSKQWLCLFLHRRLERDQDRILLRAGGMEQRIAGQGHKPWEHLEVYPVIWFLLQSQWPEVGVP